MARSGVKRGVAKPSSEEGELKWPVAAICVGVFCNAVKPRGAVL